MFSSLTPERKGDLSSALLNAVRPRIAAKKLPAGLDPEQVPEKLRLAYARLEEARRVTEILRDYEGTGKRTRHTHRG